MLREFNNLHCLSRLKSQTLILSFLVLDIRIAAAAFFVREASDNSTASDAIKGCRIASASPPT